ncbi:MAG: hypothetical protein ICV79_25695 [Flavisolibacter sp.]|nr:hypothetical protein [Flavisolibacter sp.]
MQKERLHKELKGWKTTLYDYPFSFLYYALIYDSQKIIHLHQPYVAEKTLIHFQNN